MYNHRFSETPTHSSFRSGLPLLVVEQYLESDQVSYRIKLKYAKVFLALQLTLSLGVSRFTFLFGCKVVQEQHLQKVCNCLLWMRHEAKGFKVRFSVRAGAVVHDAAV